MRSPMQRLDPWLLVSNIATARVYRYFKLNMPLVLLVLADLDEAFGILPTKRASSCHAADVGTPISDD
jgi:hypothetical protein